MSCLNLVTNAIITWNTVHIAELLRRLHAEGHQVNDDAIAHLLPAMYAYVSKHGKYRFDVDRPASSATKITAFLRRIYHLRRRPGA